MTSDSLLGHLAWRFPGATEDIATEALLYILSKQESARMALADLLKSGGADPEPMDSFSTQRVYQRTKKPDLVAFNKEEKEVLLVESKFWASLTSQQPNGYLRLMKDLPCARNLLFIAPEGRQDWLWDELLEQAKEFQITDKKAKGDVQSAAVDSNGHQLMLMLTSWETLLDRMESSGVDEDGDLQQLRGLCAPVGGDVRPTDGEAWRLEDVSQFETLIERAVAQAVEENLVSTKGLRPARWQGNYGRYFQFVNAEGDGLGVARIGIDFDRGESPLFLWLTDSSERMDQIRTQLGKELEPGDQLSIPVSPDSAYANVLKGVVGKLKEVRDRITVTEVLEFTSEPDEAGQGLQRS